MMSKSNIHLLTIRPKPEILDDVEITVSYNRRRKAVEQEQKNVEPVAALEKRRRQFQIQNQWKPISNSTPLPIISPVACGVERPVDGHVSRMGIDGRGHMSNVGTDKPTGGHMPRLDTNKPIDRPMSRLGTNGPIDRPMSRLGTNGPIDRPISRLGTDKPTDRPVSRIGAVDGCMSRLGTDNLIDSHGQTSHFSTLKPLDGHKLRRMSNSFDISDGRISRCDNETPKDLIVASIPPFPSFLAIPSPAIASGVTPLPSIPSLPIARQSPLPSFQWADLEEVWQIMISKEEIYTRDPSLLSKHPLLKPRMRSILIDWLIKVCEVYRLHKETFYLGVDFIDRYLSITADLTKGDLQLLGITALFIAAKLEEIYPPKLADFSFVTGGICSEGDILTSEVRLLKALDWDLAPMTVNSWLNIFLQLVNIDNIDTEESFVVPQYSAHAYVQISRLLDLCILDIGSLQFTYSVLAASTLYHLSSEQIALTVSGYQWLDIATCIEWMEPFVSALAEVGQTQIKFFHDVKTTDAHNIQTHSVDLKLLDKAQSLQKSGKLFGSMPKTKLPQLPKILMLSEQTLSQIVINTR